MDQERNIEREGNDQDIKKKKEKDPLEGRGVGQFIEHPHQGRGN
jgi:hypothetical protein